MYELTFLISIVELNTGALQICVLLLLLLLLLHNYKYVKIKYTG